MPLDRKDIAGIHKNFYYLLSSFGKSSIAKMGYNVHTHRYSVQGKWNEALWSKYPYHELENRKAMP